MPGKGTLTLTGKLGDVMQESAQAAMSYVRSKADEFRIPKNFNRATDVHIHIPRARSRRTARRRGSRSRPRSSRRSAALPIRKDVAMTGEITLRGKVLPIGGVKEKILAAHRSGLKTIIVPRENEKDLADIPKNVLDSLERPHGRVDGRGAEDRASPSRWTPSQRPPPEPIIGDQPSISH